MDLARLVGGLAVLLVVGLALGALVTLVAGIDPASAVVVVLVVGLLIGGVLAGVRGAGRTASPYW
jgi:hypothetical protein